MKNILKDKIEINIGLQHPLNLGPIRFLAELDGEKITKCSAILGYIHRGIEKSAQNKLFSQYLPIAERINPIDAFFYSQGYTSAVEETLGLDIPKNAQYIRVLTMEMSRIASHLLWLGGFSEILGAKAPIFYIFNLRNKILDIFKKITGGQITHNYYIFGGVRNKISNDILNDILNFNKNFNKEFKTIENIISNNLIFIDRTRNLGVITSETALPYSITGVNLRANGLPLDFRKEKPYLVYNELEFTIPTAFEGDCFARFKLRIDEIKISLNLVKQCTEWLLANSNGAVNLNINQIDIKPDAKRAISWTESARGLIMCHIVTDGSEKPKRLKWRTPSFYTIQLLEKIAVGHSIADLPVLYSSLDIASTEADR